MDGQLNRDARGAAEVASIQILAIRALVRGPAPDRIVEAKRGDGEAFPRHRRSRFGIERLLECIASLLPLATAQAGPALFEREIDIGRDVVEGCRPIARRHPATPRL